MSFLFGRRRTASHSQVTAEKLHDDLVAVIRQPVFYLSFDVPDTFEGRFDLLVLHVGLVLRRLQGGGPEHEAIAQHLVDTMFSRFDIALRELGVSDVGVPKRMKRLAEAFKGRTAAYHAALTAHDEKALSVAIGRNVLNNPDRGHDLARYAWKVERVLQSSDLGDRGRGLPDLPLPEKSN